MQLHTKWLLEDQQLEDDSGGRATDRGGGGSPTMVPERVSGGGTARGAMHGVWSLG